VPFASLFPLSFQSLNSCNTQIEEYCAMATSLSLRKLTRNARRRLSKLSKWFAGSRQPSTRRRTTLDMEVLEDRFVPATFNVNTLADTVAVNLVTGQDATGHISLRSALQAANATPGGNTINLTLPGLYKTTRIGTMNETDGVAGELVILQSSGNLTIQNTNNGSVIVDGNHLNRVFDMNPNPNPTTPKFTVTLQGFTIQNGLAQPGDGADGSGGGIRDQGNASLTLTNMAIADNAASADGGGVALENAAGSTPWTLTVNNSTISGNHAGDAGGGLETDGKGKVFINAGTVITGNTCVNQGGGIWLDAIAGGVDAVAIAVGGTAYQSAPTVTFVSLDGNGTGAQGFATIQDGQVVSVTITNSGSGYDAPPKVVFTGGNPASGATAITSIAANQSALLTVTGATIANNYAGGQGGGIGNAGSGAVTITDSTLSGNFSGTSGGGFGDENAAGTLTIQNSIFASNSTTGTGGGVSFAGASVTISNSTFRANQAVKGGGVFIDTTTTASALLNGDLFAQNSASSEGGGAELDAPNFTLTNSEFTDNFAGTNGGGGLFLGGTTFTATNLTFTDNTSSGNGGGIELQSTGVGTTQPYLINSTLVGNKALNANGGTKGGAIDMSAPTSGDLFLINDTINGNFADNGGGLFWAGNTKGSAIFENTIVAGNLASTAGPDVNNPAGFLTDLGGNLIGNLSGSRQFTTGASTQNGVDPLLGPLKNNGGPKVGADGDSTPLLTEALLFGSPAISKGVSTFGVPPQDERGLLRAGFLGSTPFDVGAFDSQGILPQIFSTVPSNGDVNPYGVAFVPTNFRTGGVLQPNDLLIANFNNAGNVQGTGTTITRITPQGQISTFFTSTLPGLSDALGILQAGYVVVGNVPNVNGTPQAGALQFIDKNGKVVLTLTDPTLIDGPWSLTVANDTGTTAQVFVSNVLSGTVSRFNLQIQNGQITVTSKVQIGSGYAHRLDNAAFVVGPAGLAYDPATLRLYVASSADNEISQIPFANTRIADAGTGNLVVNDPTHLHGPLGLVLLPNGNLLTANSDAQNVDPNQPSELVEYVLSNLTVTGRFINQLSVDPNNGGAFGLGLTTNNVGQVRFAAVDDNANTISTWSNQANVPMPDLTLVHTADPYQLVIAPPAGNGPFTYTAVAQSQFSAVEKKFGLVYEGDYFQTFAGINGKWLQSNNGSNAAHGGWYFLLSDGTLHQWDGGTTKATATTSPVVATLDPAVYSNPLQLAGAALAGTAFNEELALDLVFTGSFYNGFQGINGDWLQSANGSNAANGGWYFLLPDGTLHQWDGIYAAGTATSSPVVANLNMTYWQAPGLLYKATPPQVPGDVTAAFLGNSNVLQLSGFKNFMGTFDVQVTITNGVTTTTQEFLVHVTDQAPTLTAVPDQTVPHTGSLSVKLQGADPDPNDMLTYNARIYTDTVQTRAYGLEQQLELTYQGDYFQGFAGINGKWLLSNNGSNAARGGWYFLLSDGTLHQWDGGNTNMTATSSPVVATLDPTFYADPMTLLNAAPTPAPVGIIANVDGNTITFSNFGGFQGRLLVVATVSDGILSAGASFRDTVT
jgi:hypothetical protein